MVNVESNIGNNKSDMAVLSALNKELTKNQGVDIVILDVSKQSSCFSYFIIATGNNPAHITSLCKETKRVLGACGFTLRSTEGKQSGKWVLLDFGSIVVHLFDRESREFYNLERVWADATRVAV